MLKFSRRHAIVLSVLTVALGIGISGTALALSMVKTSNATSKTFSYIGASVTPQTVVNTDGLVIKASCATTGAPVISATTDAAYADIFGHVVSGAPTATVSSFGNDAFNSTSGPVDLTAGVIGDGDASGTAVFERGNGDVVTVTYGFDNPPTLGANANSTTCTVFGSAIASHRDN